MPVFEYEALSAEGARITGSLSAPDEVVARARIREQGHFPTDLREKSEGDGGLFAAKVKDRDLAATTRLMATLIGAGFPVVDALETLVKQQANPRLRRVLEDVRIRVREGGKLSGALETHPELFPDLYVQMVRAGETGSALQVVLNELADYLEVRSRVADKLTSALAYPLVMLVVGVAMICFLVAWVVPTMADLLRQGGMQLPMVTRLLMLLGNLLISFWWVLPFLFAGAVAGFRVALGTEGGRSAWDWFLIRSPGLGDLVLKVAMARFARLLGVLLKAGVPILQALEIVREVVQNVHLAAALERTRLEVTKGATLADPLAASGLFPPLVVDMVAAGQRAGKLTETLDRLSAGYDSEVESALETFMALLEPILILVMAVAVSFVVAGVLLPIFEMNNMRDM